MPNFGTLDASCGDHLPDEEQVDVVYDLQADARPVLVSRWAFLSAMGALPVVIPARLRARLHLVQ